MLKEIIRSALLPGLSGNRGERGMVRYHAFNRGDDETFMVKAVLSEEEAIEFMRAKKGPEACKWSYMGIIDIKTTMKKKPLQKRPAK